MHACPQAVCQRGQRYQRALPCAAPLRLHEAQGCGLERLHQHRRCVFDHMALAVLQHHVGRVAFLGDPDDAVAALDAQARHAGKADQLIAPEADAPRTTPKLPH